MKSTLLREIDRAQTAVVGMRIQLRLARLQGQDRCEHIAEAMAESHRLTTRLTELAAVVGQMKETP